jgi:hypothetical protein
MLELHKDAILNDYKDLSLSRLYKKYGSTKFLMRSFFMQESNNANLENKSTIKLMKNRLIFLLAFCANNLMGQTFIGASDSILDFQTVNVPAIVTLPQTALNTTSFGLEISTANTETTSLAAGGDAKDNTVLETVKSVTGVWATPFRNTNVLDVFAELAKVNELAVPFALNVWLITETLANPPPPPPAVLISKYVELFAEYSF